MQAGACVPVTELRSGDLVDVRITMIVSQLRHFVMLEDAYPAGMEPATENGLQNVTMSPFRVVVAVSPV